MAVAKLVCSECGTPLSAGDAFCPGCGARLEGGQAKRAGGDTQPCDSCGFMNPPEAPFCGSCGAKLGVAEPESTRAPGREAAGGQRGGGGGKLREVRRKVAGGPPNGRGRRFEPWQIVSGIAVLVLILFLAYQQFSGREGSIRVPPGGGTQTGAPPSRDVGPLRVAAASNPNDPGAALELANALFDSGAFTEAIDAYNKYLSMKPQDPDARVDLGISYYQLGLADSAAAPAYFAEAVREMEAAYKANPTHQAAAFNLGIVNLYRGDLEASTRWLRRAVEINRTSDLGARAQKLLEQHNFK